MKTTEPKPDQPEPENPLAFPQGFATSNDGSMYASWEKHPDFGGMTLRDYFAAKALQGLLSSSESRFVTFEEYAKCAFEHADTMLRYRKEQP